jgi:alpha-tubulin suppressor-like RCC1 family protein
VRASRSITTLFCIGLVAAFSQACASPRAAPPESAPSTPNTTALSVPPIEHKSPADGSAPQAASLRVKRLFAGGHSTCALLENGSLRCWGNNLFTGDKDAFIREPVKTPMTIDLGGPIEEVALSLTHACAVTASSALVCWGENKDGSLGEGGSGFVSPAHAILVDIGGHPTHVTAGVNNSCAVLSGGKVRCFGPGSTKAKGYGTVIELGAAAAQLGAAWTSVCARLDDGKVRCWGEGYGERPPFTTVDIGGVATDLVHGMRSSCVLLSSGNVRCWGQGSFGELGYGKRENVFGKGEPARHGDVEIGGKVTQLAGGSNHTCALLENRKVRCWGSNSKRQLGYPKSDDIGDDEPASAAGDVEVGGDVAQLVAGYFHTCALLTDGRVRCWGLNDLAQLARTPATAQGNIGDVVF